ncbi:MAG: DUF2442 domain-containing protein [bacterium]
MRKVCKVKVSQDYRLELTFDDGIRGVVNLSDLVGRGVFSLWSDYSAFEQVRIGSSGELVWDDKVDLCPDSLYLRATGKQPEDLFPALRDEPAHA